MYLDFACQQYIDLATQLCIGFARKLYTDFACQHASCLLILQAAVLLHDSFIMILPASWVLFLHAGCILSLHVSSSLILHVNGMLILHASCISTKHARYVFARQLYINFTLQFCVVFARQFALFFSGAVRVIRRWRRIMHVYVIRRLRQFECTGCMFLSESFSVHWMVQCMTGYGVHIQGSRLQSTLLVMDEHGRRTSRGLSVSIRAGEIRASVVSLASAGEFKASVSFHCHRLKYGP